jgi:hypothetical protein
MTLWRATGTGGSANAPLASYLMRTLDKDLSNDCFTEFLPGTDF